MKKVISITITLCLVIGSILPVYAESWTPNQAVNVTNDVNDIQLDTHNIYTYLRDFLLSYSSGQTSNWTFGDLYWEIKRIGSWVAPIGTNDGDYETLWSVLMNIAIDTRSYLPSIPSILTYVSNWMQSNNSYLEQLKIGLTNYRYGSSGSSAYSWEQVAKNGHGQLFVGTVGQPMNGQYKFRQLEADGTSEILSNGIQWQYGSPIGNIAVMLQRFNSNFVTGYLTRYSADLKHYNDTLSTWDSQGDTLEQVLFTPESAIQGLYRYLAFTQRDVARLTYVLASDEEIEAREKARENQNAVLDNFIDPEGEGAVDDADFGDIANASGSIKDNFNTGVNPSGIFSIFSTDDKATPWFSNETKNELMPQTRAGYSTPLLDAYYEEIMGVFDNAR